MTDKPNKAPTWIPDAEVRREDRSEAKRVRAWVEAHPLPWGRRASAGRPESEVAANGARQIRSIRCPADEPRYLTQDGHMWLPDTPALDLQKVGRLLEAAFPKSYRR